MAWTLYSLAKHPETQNKLRAEVSELPGDNASYDEINTLPYLDAVVRELLRVHAPVVSVTDRPLTITLTKHDYVRWEQDGLRRWTQSSHFRSLSLM